MDNRPIGVFDSGVGGLTAYKELEALLPNEDIIYFGDTGRLPYGSKIRETIIDYAQQDIKFLLSHDVKFILAACGTVSSTLPQKVADALPVQYSGVVGPAVQTACALTLCGRIGVIGTNLTIRTNAYGKAIRAIKADAHVFGNACPLFVPLVENGQFSPKDPIVRLVAETYLQPLRREGIDTLILGCTHYPLLYDVINEVLDYQVTLIDPGREAAKSVQSFLTVNGLLRERQQEGRREFYVTDSAEDFCSVAKIFLQQDVSGSVKKISLS